MINPYVLTIDVHNAKSFSLTDNGSQGTFFIANDYDTVRTVARREAAKEIEFGAVEIIDNVRGNSEYYG